ncbi:signal peptidase I [Halosimplex sp. J119]
MSGRFSVGTVLEAVLIVFLVAMVAGQVFGQPVLLGYVETGSMQPTLNPGEGFVAVPAAIAGDIEEGDVVTFRAKEIHGGGLTTHRIVEETDRGFVTRGDNNPFTDQDGNEPPVKRAQIVAVVWQPSGSVLAIPGVGTLVSGSETVMTAIQRQLSAALGTRSLLGTQGVAYLLLGVSVLAYVADLCFGSDRRDRSRETRRDSGMDTRLLVGAFAVVVVLVATATMVAPSGPQEFGVVSAESESPGVRVIEAGTNESTGYKLGNGGFVPMVAYFEPQTDGVDVQPCSTVIPGRSTVNATLTLSAPPETGYYRQYLTEHRYLYVLPESMLRALYEVHPWLPIVVIDALIGVSFYAFGVSLGGTGRIRSRSRDGPSRLDRLRSRVFD